MEDKLESKDYKMNLSQQRAHKVKKHTINWNFIEDYIKSLPYSKSLIRE